MTKILVIEDDTILRNEVADWLSFEGYQVFSAEDGVKGVEAAFRNLPDLIVCDITMPRLDGYGVLLEMHANPTTAGIPFIFLTARAAYEDIRKGMSFGADDYVTKPFTNQELLRAVQIRLTKKAAQVQDYRNEVSRLEQALADAYEQRLLKAKLIAMFTHDFYNPLTSILSSNSLLRDYIDQMDEKRRLGHFARIEASARQLQQMLNDMLLLMQMDTGNFEFRPEWVSPGAFFRGVVEEFQAIYGETHQLLFESRFADSIDADPRLLRALAVNLISNAIKYSPQGSEVRVTVEKEDSQWVLTVQDQGIGIPETDQARLFDPFQRGSNVGDISGTGLGLAIVKQAVDAHGGSVRLESQVGTGTTAILAVPIRQIFS